MLVLLIMAMTQLSAADDTFSSLLEGLRDALTLDLDQVWFYRFLLSRPVGAYVFGLLAGLGLSLIHISISPLRRPSSPRPPQAALRAGILA